MNLPTHRCFAAHALEAVGVQADGASSSPSSSASSSSSSLSLSSSSSCSSSSASASSSDHRWWLELGDVEIMGVLLSVEEKKSFQLQDRVIALETEAVTAARDLQQLRQRVAVLEAACSSSTSSSCACPSSRSISISSFSSSSSSSSSASSSAIPCDVPLLPPSPFATGGAAAGAEEAKTLQLKSANEALVCQQTHTNVGSQHKHTNEGRGDDPYI
jgi:hypothetical protein